MLNMKNCQTTATLVGSSDTLSITCPTPAERDEQGLLLYGKDLKALDA
jgi:hypothetical protein